MVKKEGKSVIGSLNALKETLSTVAVQNEPIDCKTQDEIKFKAILHSH